MKLFTPFTIPKKENCDLCRVAKTNAKRGKSPLFFILVAVSYCVSTSTVKRCSN